MYADARVELLEGDRVETLGDGDLELVERERTVVRDELHLYVARTGRPARHVIGAQHRETTALVVDEGHRHRTPGVDPLATQELLLRPPGSGVVDHVHGATQVGEQVALPRTASTTDDGIVRGTVELGVRRHHQRRVGVEDRALADAGGTGDHRRVAAEGHGGEAAETTPVDELQQGCAPLHGVVGGVATLPWSKSPSLNSLSSTCSISSMLTRRPPRRRARHRPPRARSRWRCAASRGVHATAQGAAAARRPR